MSRSKKILAAALIGLGLAATAGAVTATTGGGHVSATHFWGSQTG